MPPPPDQVIAFTNSFNKQRGLLAGFAKCWSLEELHIIRDGLYLGLASDLLPSAYAPVQERIVTHPSVALESAGIAALGDADDAHGRNFTTMIQVARSCPEWPELVKSVLDLADKVDCDLPGIWKTLEDGRMEWLQAVNGAQGLKVLLQEMLRRDSATTSVGDVSDAKMIWMYALSMNIPALKSERDAWAKAVQMKDALRPLVQYKAELWDARHESWRALDLGVQAAADRGGSSIDDVWNVGMEGGNV